jgi:hypothetical protein
VESKPHYRSAKKYFHSGYLKSSNVFFLVLSPNFLRAVSSVGSEHCLDKAGVTGSSPVQRTIFFFNKKAALFKRLLRITNNE